jgi:hypothetical protein
METQFNATFFSNDSFDLFPKNTQSEFTVSLEKELTLEGDWEVGISELCLNPSGNSEFIKIDSRDVVSFAPKLQNPKLFSNLDEFVNYVLNLSVDPFLYTKNYFYAYTNEDILFDELSLKKYFPGDFLSALPLQGIGYNFQVSELFKIDETLNNFVPKHYFNQPEKSKKFASVPMIFYPTLHYTMKQVLNTCYFGSH